MVSFCSYIAWNDHAKSFFSLILGSCNMT